MAINDNVRIALLGYMAVRVDKTMRERLEGRVPLTDQLDVDELDCAARAMNLRDWLAAAYPDINAQEIIDEVDQAVAAELDKYEIVADD